MDAFTSTTVVVAFPEVDIPSDNESSGSSGSTPGCVIARQEVDIPSDAESSGSSGSTPGCVIA